MLNLTKRESEVMELVAEGKRNRPIAFTLGVSEQTIKNHMSTIFLKLGVDSRTEAIVKVFQEREANAQLSSSGDTHLPRAGSQSGRRSLHTAAGNQNEVHRLHGRGPRGDYRR